MPLPLTVSCFSKIQIGFTFPVLAHLGSPRQRAVKQVCVCVIIIINFICQHKHKTDGSTTEYNMVIYVEQYWDWEAENAVMSHTLQQLSDALYVDTTVVCINNNNQQYSCVY